ncbi:Helix-turn-helix protein [Halobacteroides halobius DSM 5150]|uniref:Helix-turn-helix protein n=1 Tax=Halobacteroides halobius (strain ATCC 35273 / DSM 5150 / MD-1) TaxID=748449 RepID=L0KD90_HALHC|nr:helix-turn-helix transcriptional regulator [Halobacteroides halobius]AGB42058.1 Helix-turn-helix protein [Halobacteroides halobius DSM 5150]
MDFADFINGYMDKNNLSYRKMGELCSISHAEISRLAKGKEPSIKTIDKISQGTEVARNRLLKLAGYLEDDTADKNLNQQLPEEVLKLLGEEELDFLIELSQDDQRQILLKESKKLSDEDLAKIIKIIKTFATEDDVPPK